VPSRAIEAEGSLTQIDYSLAPFFLVYSPISAFEPNKIQGRCFEKSTLDHRTVLSTRKT